MTDNELQDLFQFLSAGRTPGKQDFNASKMFSLLEDPFSIWCSFHAPKEEAVPEPNRYESLKIRTDRNARDQWIKAEFPGVVFVSGEDETARFKNTLSAMARGESAIANANSSINGARLAVRLSIMQAFCPFVTSVVMRVTSDEV